MLSISVSGLSELQAQLTELRDVALAVKVLGVAARKAFMPVLESARSMVPMDSGELRDSLKLTVKKPGAGGAVVVVGLRIGKGTGARQARVAAAAFGEGQIRSFPPARRWHFIEFGTAKLAAHPFLRPALDRNAAPVLEALKTEIAKEIAKVLKKRARGPTV